MWEILLPKFLKVIQSLINCQIWSHVSFNSSAFLSRLHFLLNNVFKLFFTSLFSLNFGFILGFRIKNTLTKHQLGPSLDHYFYYATFDIFSLVQGKNRFYPSLGVAIPDTFELNLHFLVWNLRQMLQIIAYNRDRKYYITAEQDGPSSRYAFV